MAIRKIIKKEMPAIMPIAALLLTALAVSASIIYVYTNNNGESETKTKMYNSEHYDICDIYEISENIKYEKKSSYSTPYGTFKPIDHILEINEYMSSHPNVLTAEECRIYVTEENDIERADDVMRYIQSLSDEICEGITDDYDKAYALAMWTGTNIAYDFDAAEDDGSALSVTSLDAIIRNNYRTTCAGFANFYSALCHAQGIYCLNMKGGTASDGWSRSQLEEAPANHEWNAVIIGGKWYYTDCTWISDKSYKDGIYSGENNIKPFYAMFGFGEMSIEHRIDRCEHRCYEQ